MDRDQPEATAVAIAGDRIVAVGSRAEVEATLDGESYTVERTFADKVILPGLIEQHLHPFLGALVLSSVIIATEDWQLPGRTERAARNSSEYRDRLRRAEADLVDPNEWLFSWGYHALWHGPLDRAALDGVSATRPIAVWQRSCHEFYLNSAAIRTLGLSEVEMQGQGRASEMMSFEQGHWWETGMNLILPQLLKVLANPERMQHGLMQFVDYLHASGVTVLRA